MSEEDDDLTIEGLKCFDSDSDAPPTFSRGLAMDWRAKRV